MNCKHQRRHPARIVTYPLLTLVCTLLLHGCYDGPVTVTRNGPVMPSGDNPVVVFIAGRDSHLPGAHEHEAGSLLLASALRERYPDVATVNIYGGWPEDDAILDEAAALVMYCDGGEGHLINPHLERFNQLLSKGVGVVALHYCVEVPKESPSSQSLRNAIGGYFETGWSVNPHWEAGFASIPQHSVTHGITPFTLNDEWYFNMRFADQGVTPILAAIPPPETMRRGNGPHSGNDAVRKLVAAQVPQVTAWAYERPGGGRGFGYTGGHFHANWEHPMARNVVLNAIAWSAGLESTPRSTPAPTTGDK